MLLPRGIGLGLGEDEARKAGRGRLLAGWTPCGREAGFRLGWCEGWL
jgi:hypothetical protein